MRHRKTTITTVCPFLSLCTKIPNRLVFIQWFACFGRKSVQEVALIKGFCFLRLLSHYFNPIISMGIPLFFSICVEIEQLGGRKFDKVRLHSFRRIEIQFYRDGKKNYGFHALVIIITELFRKLLHEKNTPPPEENERKKNVCAKAFSTWMKLNGI